ncbi:MAG: TerB family tellurite resistance protein [Gemmatimonadales bacterium]|nr:TerB family tellurite resistance protein [Gemmatimonadales bacterium]NIN11344.1 TerB family tellurite resistance protein [Gemmatimonadales bacterium]NIN49954.1 TerB family tellurite resistance protein [Gemmatimonadales bacterium]NIP07418.1 TerB family tellurite resistance protein [Gemmatimonadales bacterium]NIR00485.1 TerB family tellurite resistance protein [Gemmatimonadales bacterium]
MLESIRKFFEQNLSPVAEPAEAAEQAATPGRDRLAIAACALLLELAHADEEFTEDEACHIEEVLTRHFAVPLDAARELMKLADEERRQAVDLYQFTSLITSSYDEGQRMVLAEVMWRLVYSDGELAKHEEYLMRRLSNLLQLRPGYLAEARKRAVEAAD